jgi:hypothetical protein
MGSSRGYPSQNSPAWLISLESASRSRFGDFQGVFGAASSLKAATWPSDRASRMEQLCHFILPLCQEFV